MMGDELLLLAISPGRRGMRIRVRSPQRLRFALRGAELAELGLLGRIAVGERRIEVVDRAPVGTGRLDGVLRALEGANPPATVESWLRATPRSLTSEYLSRLHDRKVVRVHRSRDRVGRTRHDILAVDPVRRRALVSRVTASLRAAAQDGAGGAQAEHDVVLAVLAHSAHLSRAVHPGLRGLPARRRLKALAAAGGRPGAPAGAVEAAYGAAARARDVQALTRGLYSGIDTVCLRTFSGADGHGSGASAGDAYGGGHHGHGGGGHHGHDGGHHGGGGW
ncbi:GOLPH3/VPS74 family protein [Actinacidiphila epipremni]|nr:GPP34 family phosphoprotein [Actinacidiphila epipremni]